MLPLFYSDFYKTDHRRQYPTDTTMVYSNLTPRSTRIPGVNKVVVFGLQYFVKEYLISQFSDNFFNKNSFSAASEIMDYKRVMDSSLGKDSFPLDHLRDLYRLKYLPIKIKALPEGSLCPLRVPILTIKNTKPEFFWITNFIETILCNIIWQPITSATIAFEYRKLLQKFAEETSDNLDFVQWQGHDFSFRGMSSLESALTSGMAHLLSFTGTDTIPAIVGLEKYYNVPENEFIGGSVPATEHSVMCLGGDETELETFRRLMGIYPTGILSIVSDTWNYWKVLTEILPVLKNEIMNRNGKIVIRPDSGDPVKIVCGDSDGKTSTERDGTIEVLWNLFGGKINSKGYKELDPHIGCIYGDGINLDRCERICEGLKKKGFASTNMVYGIGSFSYQLLTRDTFGLAFKATAGVVNNELKVIYKDPITDDGTKKSAKGLLQVVKDNYGNFSLNENVSDEKENSGELKTIFKDGVLVKDYSLSDIRKNLLSNLNESRTFKK